MQRNNLKKDFVKNISENLEFYKKWHNNDHVSGLVKREDEQTLRELEALIKSSEESNILATSGTLKPFINLLKNRWERIKDTDADYLHAPGTVSDAICRYMAEQLAQYSFDSALSLLIPSLNSKANDLVNMAKLHEFVLSDDGARLLNAYDYARRQNNPALGGVNENYSDTEKARLVNKTDKLKAFNQTVAENAAEGYTIAVPKQNAKFKHYLQSRSVPVSSAGFEGMAKLRKSIHPGIETFAQLSEVLNAYSPQEAGSLLDSFTVEELRKILLNGKSFQAALQDQTHYAGDERHAKQVLLAFVVLYAYELSARQSSHKSMTGWLLGKPSKEAKQPAAELYRALLSSDATLEEIDKKLDENKEHASALNDTSFFGYSASDLSALRNQIKQVKSPAYREEKPQQYGWFGRLTGAAKI